MTKALTNLTNSITYWLLFPALQMYLRGSIRTRVAVIHKNKVLLVRPRLGGGKWELPGGGVHRAEEIKVGALRELYEETQITLANRALKKADTFTTGYKLFRFDVICFVARVNVKPAIKLQYFEIAEAGWFTRKDIKSLRLADDVEQAVQRCFKS